MLTEVDEIKEFTSQESPSVVTNQGKEAENLCREKRSRWISAISRDDLTDDILDNDRVCGRHFVLIRLPKAGIDLTLTGFQHLV